MAIEIDSQSGAAVREGLAAEPRLASLDGSRALRRPSLGRFRSPRRGTFGGFEFDRPIRIELLERFVDYAEKIMVRTH